MQYPSRIIHLLKRYEWISMRLCYIYKPWMSIQVFLSEWIFRHGYYRATLHGYFNPE